MQLQTRSLVVGYGARPVLGPLDLKLQAGEFTCLIGANGAGKSTLLRTLCSMQKPLSGEVHVQGRPLSTLSASARARMIAMVLTDRLDDVAMTGRELVALGRYPHLHWLARLSEYDHAIIEHALADADAVYLADKPLDAMSDGERQKVLFARALAQQPQLLILDEATAFLDLPRRVQTMHWLRHMAREKQIAVLLSTHDLELALRHADTFWLIDPNGVVRVGAPEDLALAGHLETTFRREGLTFDLSRGELHRHDVQTRSIRVEGNGVRHVWACRAVHRAGYVLDEQSALHLIVGESRYLLQAPDASCDFGSLSELVFDLKARRGKGMTALGQMS